jgi:ADP-heptose:LPS heptosyltransferase
MPQVLLRFPHGLGDTVQVSVILKHLRKYRPDWLVDIKVGRGKHTGLFGLCRKVYHDQEPDPAREIAYNTVVDIGFFENYSNYQDRPNSKVTNCLQDVFNIPYDSTLSRYYCHLSEDARRTAAAYLRSIGAKEGEDGRFNAVILHYLGNTSPAKKNLAHWQAAALCKTAIKAGCIPVILDWDNRSDLPDQKTIFNPKAGDHDIWGSFGSGDASVIAGLITLSRAFVGIDSGPGKVASATDTPNLSCWVGHHPLQFHDPSPSTWHLVPQDHRQMPPCNGNLRMVDYFFKNYQFFTYAGEHGLVAKATEWLAGALHLEESERERAVQFVLPAGIGDTTWALLKIKDIAAGRPIDLIVSGEARKEVDQRAVPYLKRFKFVREVMVLDIPILHDRDNPTNSRGRYNYVSDGLRGEYHYLIPNTVLETGARLEQWLPDFKIDWDLFNDFSWDNTARGTTLGRGLSPFVAFYLGPEAGSASEGHNRNWLWEPRHWIEMGQFFKERGLNVCVVGAPYDHSFWERYVQQGVKEANQSWVSLIGKLEIGETFALLKEAKCFLSYQCGLGIVNHYLGGNTVMWWRPEQDSCHPHRLVSFDERMKDAWIRPGWEKKYMGLIYTRESPADIIREIDRRGWLHEPQKVQTVR